MYYQGLTGCETVSVNYWCFWPASTWSHRAMIEITHLVVSLTENIYVFLKALHLNTDAIKTLSREHGKTMFITTFVILINNDVDLRVCQLIQRLASYAQLVPFITPQGPLNVCLKKKTKTKTAPFMIFCLRLPVIWTVRPIFIVFIVYSHIFANNHWTENVSFTLYRYLNKEYEIFWKPST